MEGERGVGVERVGEERRDVRRVKEGGRKREGGEREREREREREEEKIGCES